MNARYSCPGERCLVCERFIPGGRGDLVDHMTEHGVWRVVAAGWRKRPVRRRELALVVAGFVALDVMAVTAVWLVLTWLWDLLR